MTKTEREQAREELAHEYRRTHRTSKDYDEYRAQGFVVVSINDEGMALLIREK